MADAGATQGKWFAQQAKAKGWKPSDTALVECTDPDNGPSVNVMFDTAPKALRPPGSRSRPGTSSRSSASTRPSRSAETTITDWFTAHPKSKFPHVMLNSIDDERMQGITNAVRRASRKATCSHRDRRRRPRLKQIKSGTQMASVAYFPELYGEWLIPLMEDVIAGNPVPSFTGSGLVIINKQNVKKYYP